MSWTDERVEQLSKLWLEGRSASQIAAELGMGVTRNAVIGKVHRLGLAGRAKTPAPAPSLASRAKPKVQVQAAPEAREPETVDPVVVPLRSYQPPVPQPVADLAIPPSERVTIMDLRESSCRWPMGDPSNAEFRFCGAKTTVGSGPYCATHARLAFQPTQDRRRDRDRYARIA